MSTQAQEEAIELAEHGGVRIVTLNRPHRRNALTHEVRRELADLVARLPEDEDATALVLASRETAFSAGQDLREARDFSPAEIPQWIEEHMNLYRAILACPLPVIAAVDGCCVGAGFQIALLCDLRVATQQSFFAMPELDDAIPCILGVWTLWDVIGRSRTTEMVLTNRRVYADEALSWGIVSHVVDEGRLLPEAIEIATQLASKPALALRLTKERLAMLALEGADALAVHATYAHGVAFASGEPERAMDAFLSHGRSVV
jgi:enoyl-CoA hydratase/carnithine racemase